ncbi:hypothetical protein DPF_0403 [Desulfoplanes formicivorans]|uniref:Uncharacterized protein n=1 Tax=Desulfoplanes formicivorans TaxID=1592317 RepID=A0A194AC32_9BACT|nr:hypothetical protein DPF_0403 [Desulfoplanes formicivorans]
MSVRSAQAEFPFACFADGAGQIPGRDMANRPMLANGPEKDVVRKDIRGNFSLPGMGSFKVLGNPVFLGAKNSRNTMLVKSPGHDDFKPLAGGYAQSHMPGSGTDTYGVGD